MKNTFKLLSVALVLTISLQSFGMGRIFSRLSKAGTRLATHAKTQLASARTKLAQSATMARLMATTKPAARRIVYGGAVGVAMASASGAVAGSARRIQTATKGEIAEKATNAEKKNVGSNAKQKLRDALSKYKVGEPALSLYQRCLVSCLGDDVCPFSCTENCKDRNNWGEGRADMTGTAEFNELENLVIEIRAAARDAAVANFIKNGISSR